MSDNDGPTCTFCGAKRESNLIEGHEGVYFWLVCEACSENPTFKLAVTTVDGAVVTLDVPNDADVLLSLCKGVKEIRLSGQIIKICPS